MTEKDFQTEMLKGMKEVKGEIGEIKGEIKEMKGEIGEMKGEIKSLHSKFDRLDDRIDEVEKNLSQEIRMQGAYLNQAFDRMSYYQQSPSQSNFVTK